MKGNGGIPIITDILSDDHKKETYMFCTVHWISETSGSLQQTVLFCMKFMPSVKSAENIRNEMVRSLIACDITLDQIKQCITFVTDRGANIKKAFDSFMWLPCSCHILNTILYHAFRLQPVVN